MAYRIERIIPGDFRAITYEVVEVSKHAWGRYGVYSYDKWQEQFPDVVPAGRYDKLEDAQKHAESVTYKMVVVDSKAESRGFIYTNWSDGITPEQCGASQLACNIVNETFLSLDGFAAMRKQMAGTDYTAEHFGAELARIVDRNIQIAGRAVRPLFDASDETELYHAFNNRGSSSTKRKVAALLREMDRSKGRTTREDQWYAEPAATHRTHTCLECKHQWSSPVVLSEHSPAISGERTEQCPSCNSRGISSSPMHAPKGWESIEA